MSVWLNGCQVSRYLVAFYCKQGGHWVHKKTALFDAMGSPIWPKHHRKLRLSAHKKNHGDKNES